jgi:transcriptional regulator with XRE-family HTH domain
MMIPAQCRAARAILDWSQQDLADAAKVANATIRNFEAGRSEPRRAILEALQRALEAAGVEFIGAAADMDLKAVPDYRKLIGVAVRMKSLG